MLDPKDIAKVIPEEIDDVGIGTQPAEPTKRHQVVPLGEAINHIVSAVSSYIWDHQTSGPSYHGDDLSKHADAVIQVAEACGHPLSARQKAHLTSSFESWGELQGEEEPPRQEFERYLEEPPEEPKRF